jgi:hypothetical protein
MKILKCLFHKDKKKFFVEYLFKSRKNSTKNDYFFPTHPAQLPILLLTHPFPQLPTPLPAQFEHPTEPELVPRQ